MNDDKVNERIAVVRNFYRRLDEEFFGNPMEDAIRIYLAPDVVYHFPGVEAVGHQEYWDYISGNVTNEVRILHVLKDVSIDPSDENNVVVGYIDALGEKPDGTTWSMPGSAVYRVVEGKIVEAWVKRDSID